MSKSDIIACTVLWCFVSLCYFAASLWGMWHLKNAQNILDGSFACFVSVLCIPGTILSVHSAYRFWNDPEHNAVLGRC